MSTGRINSGSQATFSMPWMSVTRATVRVEWLYDSDLKRMQREFELIQYRKYPHANAYFSYRKMRTSWPVRTPLFRFEAASKLHQAVIKSY